MMSDWGGSGLLMSLFSDLYLGNDNSIIGFGTHRARGHLFRGLEEHIVEVGEGCHFVTIPQTERVW